MAALREDRGTDARRATVPPATRRITVVDHDEDFVDLLRDIFSEGFTIIGESGITSVNDLADTAPHLLIVDLDGDGLGGLDGRHIIALARRHRSLWDVPIIVCTSDLMALMHEADELTATGNVHLIAKPFEIEGIERLVRRSLDGGAQRPLRVT
jgi:DNA-binding response OmpR family regulator